MGMKGGSWAPAPPAGPCLVTLYKAGVVSCRAAESALPAAQAFVWSTADHIGKTWPSSSVPLDIIFGNLSCDNVERCGSGFSPPEEGQRRCEAEKCVLSTCLFACEKLIQLGMAPGSLQFSLSSLGSSLVGRWGVVYLEKW